MKITIYAAASLLGMEEEIKFLQSTVILFRSCEVTLLTYAEKKAAHGEIAAPPDHNFFLLSSLHK